MGSRFLVAVALTTGAALVAPADPAAASPAGTLRRAATRPSGGRAVAVRSSVVSPASLNDASASGPASAGAVGADAETGFRQGTPLILHWNGAAWSRVALPSVARPGFLSSVSAGSRSSAWVLGTDAKGTVLLHWNGRRWRTAGFPRRATATMTSLAAPPNGR